LQGDRPGGRGGGAPVSRRAHYVILVVCLVAGFLVAEALQHWF
jgi:hypothetical protein